jgi:two-component system sensor kinase FixL
VTSKGFDEAAGDESGPLSGEAAFYRHPWEETPLGPADAWPEVLRHWIRFMLPSAQPILLVWGAERTLIFNRAYSHLLGGNWLKVLGASAPQIWAPIWPDVGKVLDDLFAGNSGVMAQQPIRSFASGFTERRHYSRSYSPIRDNDGRVLGGAIFTSDRTADAQEQQRLGTELDVLRRLLDNATSFVVVTEGAQHRITYTNAAFRKLVQQREVMGLTVEQAFPELVEQRFAETLTRAMETGEAIHVIELPLGWQQSPDAPREIRYVTAAYQPLFDANGKAIGVVGEGHEVTDHVLAKAALNDLHNEHVHVAQVNAMGTMAATLAHEINQPLTAATNYLAASQRLLGADIDPVAADGLGQACDSLLRAADIIRSLRSMTARGEPKWESFDLALAAREAVKLVRAAGYEDAEIILDGDGALLVTGDRVQIEQVLVNLVRNAVEAVARTQKRQVRLALRQEANEAEVSVADSGPGVPPGTAESIFESFATAKDSGMGIGLSICRTIIEAHGGRIWLDEGAAEGACFRFTLRLARDSEPDPAAA